MIVGPIAFLVWVLLFPCVKSLGNATELEQCLSNVTNVTSLLNDLSAAYSACGCGVDPCAFAVSTGFDLGLHVGAVFIILVASSFWFVCPSCVQVLSENSYSAVCYYSRKVCGYRRDNCSGADSYATSWECFSY
jgi:hypothetical protein